MEEPLEQPPPEKPSIEGSAPTSAEAQPEESVPQAKPDPGPMPTKLQIFVPLVALVLVFVGIYIIKENLEPALRSKYAPDQGRWLRVTISPATDQMSGKFDPMESTSALKSSLILMGATALICVALLAIARTVTLFWLVLSVLFIGLMGALPHWCKPDKGAIAQMDYECTSELAPEQVDALRDFMQPKAAMQTLPAEFLEELHLKPGEGVQEVSLEYNGEHGGLLILKITFDPELETSARQALTCFYSSHLQMQVRVSQRQKGQLAPREIMQSTLQSLWDHYEPGWAAKYFAAEAETPKKKR